MRSEIAPMYTLWGHTRWEKRRNFRNPVGGPRHGVPPGASSMGVSGRRKGWSGIPHVHGSRQGRGVLANVTLVGEISEELREAAAFSSRSHTTAYGHTRTENGTSRVALSEMGGEKQGDAASTHYF